MLLPDPYDADWETCLAAYRHARMVAVNIGYKILQDLARVDDRIEEADTVSREEEIELGDRLRVQNILQVANRQQMVGMRYYLDLVRVVHKKADRMTYERVYHNARTYGISPYVTRRMLEAERQVN